MTEILHTLMNPLPNAVMTVLMAVIVLYWIFAFIGGFGLDDLDFHFDMDTDVDAEIDIDGGDVDAGAHHEPGFFMKTLNFINVGKVPFMLVLSTLKFLMWIFTLIATSFVNVAVWGWQSVFILIPIAIISLFVTRYATNPMVKMFKEIGYKGENAIVFSGRSGKMLSTIEGNKIGSAEFIIEKNPMKLNVVSKTGEELKYGDYIRVSNESHDKKVHYVIREPNLKNLESVPKKKLTKTGDNTEVV